jgi:hypothetical protein
MVVARLYLAVHTAHTEFRAVGDTSRICVRELERHSLGKEEIRIASEPGIGVYRIGRGYI